jgi:hypothetical protein
MIKIAHKRRFMSYITISVFVMLIGVAYFEWYKYQLFLEYLAI